MKKTRLLTLILLAVGKFPGFSQTKPDTNYIKTYKEHFSMTPFFSRKALELSVGNRHFLPNSPINIGIGASVKNTIVNFETSIAGIGLSSRAKYGRSHITDLQLHHYGRKVFVDMFYQKYRGFYHIDPEDKSISIYPGVAIRQIGGEAHYLFNGNKLSVKAAYRQNERQLTSVGSWVLGGGVYVSTLHNGESLGLTGHRRSDNVQLNAGGGYAYSWVPDRHWLLSGLATIGLNFGNEWNKLKEGHINVFPRAFSKMSAGYTSETWGAYFSALVHNDRIYPSPEQGLTITSLNFQLAYIKHFDHFLRKKAK